MPDNTINITFSTNAGDIEDDFPENQPLHSLKKEIMGKAKLDVSQSDEFNLTFNGEILDESQTLKELGIQDGAILVLERKEITKI